MAGPFELDLRRFAANAGDAIDETVRKTLINFSEKIIDRSPVGMPDTWKRPPPAGYKPGQFRANWQLTVGSPAGGTIAAIDPTGAVTKEKIAAVIPQQAGGKVYHLVNNLDYAWPLETGWSGQAPFGFVGLTVLEFSLIVSMSAAAVRAGGSSSPAELVSA